MLFSRVKISCFRAKAHLVFHCCLYIYRTLLRDCGTAHCFTHPLLFAPRLKFSTTSPHRVRHCHHRQFADRTRLKVERRFATHSRRGKNKSPTIAKVFVLTTFGYYIAAVVRSDFLRQAHFSFVFISGSGFLTTFGIFHVSLFSAFITPHFHDQSIISCHLVLFSLKHVSSKIKLVSSFMFSDVVMQRFRTTFTRTENGKKLLTSAFQPPFCNSVKIFAFVVNGRYFSIFLMHIFKD